MKQYLFASLIVAGIFYFGLAAFLFFYQRNLLYLPDTSRPSPATAGFADMKVVNFNTSDGLEIYGWYKRAALGKPTIVYFHGNAGNLFNHSWIARPLLRAGYGVLLLEYRGYGGNTGSPTEAGLMADGRAAIEFLKASEIVENDMIFYGMSLGTGVATKMATEYSPRALVLQSPYTSIAAAGQHHYWYLPVSLLIKDRFNTMDFIGQVSAPLLVVYGGADTIIPPVLSEELYGAANQPKSLKLIEGAGHNGLADTGGIKAVLDFLSEVLDQ